MPAPRRLFDSGILPLLSGQSFREGALTGSQLHAIRSMRDAPFGVPIPSTHFGKTFKLVERRTTWGEDRVYFHDVRRGPNTVDSERFKNRDLGDSVASEISVFRLLASGFRGVIFSSEALAFNDTSFGVVQYPVQ